ncbi:uncharacterized protein LOC102804014 [Saccoglossus kowalevskii]
MSRFHQFCQFIFFWTTDIWRIAYWYYYNYHIKIFPLIYQSPTTEFYFFVNHYFIIIIAYCLFVCYSWNVAHNINKREKIIDQLRLKFENKYSEKEYQFAVRRAYENQRIRAKEAANMTLKTKNTKNKRSHTLRWQTMKRRGRVVEERRREPYGKKYNLN